jgi:hypothetical protein
MVRPGASFCFKCGKHFELAGAESAGVAAPPEVAEFHETAPDIAAPPRENVLAFPAAPETKDETKAEAEVAPEPAPVVVKAKPELTSAAALRRKPKPQREKLEMVWEQPEGTTNPVFIAGAVAIFILLLVILGFVYYLK